MKLNLATYFDKNYLSKFLNLKSSLDQFNIDYKFYVLCLDDFVYKFFKKNNFDNIEIILLNDVENKYDKLKIVKNNREIIEYYFTLSPFLPKYIFEEKKINQIVYVDTDYYFFNNPTKLFNYSNDASVTIIRQNASKKYGKYNVGLIFFNFNFEETHKIINEWSNQCLENCSDQVMKNSYADQKYLDSWISKLKFIRIYEPEYSSLAPWDSNRAIEENIDNMVAFHFHALKFNKDNFVTGFHNYNKKNSNKILEKIYNPYIRNLRLIESKYNLVSNSVRDHRKSKIAQYVVLIRKFKSFFKRILYWDNYKYPE